MEASSNYGLLQFSQIIEAQDQQWLNSPGKNSAICLSLAGLVAAALSATAPQQTGSSGSGPRLDWQKLALVGSRQGSG